MKLKIILAVILLTSNLYSQNKEFEGLVNYKIVVKNPTPEIISDSLWNARVGKTTSNHQFYYKGSSYKNIIDGKELQIYKPKSNEIYNYRIGKDTIFNNILNASKAIDSLISIEKSDKAESILGYSCEKLVFKGKLAETTYYYSKELNVPAENYVNHNYGNWYEYLEQTNSLPLKIIVKNRFLHMVMTAVNIEETELNDSDFDLPSVKKSID
ncbi:MAG: DUF4412 domain-containing protein [Bacteroidota bacterium]